MIELLWSKERILEVYLNVSEMGEGIFGVQAAAQSYFNKNANNLNNKEAAMIAASLPNPKKFTVKPASRYVLRRYPNIIRQMNNLSGDPDIEALIK
jgi:monofunctional biosynthetic peptidoglycan transglycosylase